MNTLHNNQPIKNTLDSIKHRRTIKVLSEQPLPNKPPQQDLVETLITSAYYAPFHYPASAEHRSKMTALLPYRFYVLDSQNCRLLAEKLPQLSDKTGKIPAMLNTADYLIYTTWCPVLSDKKTADDSLFVADLVNMEHIAAAGAAIQNLLLTATALGYENYWSSGGPLRESFAYDLLSIPEKEILLGAIFIFPNLDELENTQTTHHFSKKRHQRGELGQLYRTIKLD